MAWCNGLVQRAGERPPVGAKDWNDALRAAQAREESWPQGLREEREQTHDQGHGGCGARGRAKRVTQEELAAEVERISIGARFREEA